MPRVALTLDDGPGPSTARILDILRVQDVRASFFVLGRNVEEAPWCDGDAGRARALVERAFAEGHTVGNHTYSHARPEGWRALADDLRRNDALLATIGGAPGLAPVRLPYGIQTPEPRLAVLASLGRTHVHWTGDFEDWTLAPADGPALAARMAAHVEEFAALGLDAVLDLHDSGTGSRWGYEREATADAVALFIEEAGRRGWSFFSVPVAD